MAVKIMIKRKASDKQSEALTALLQQFRALAIKQPGYISGETLRRVDQPGECLVISTWKTVDHWNNWIDNPARLRIQNQIDILLGSETSYEIFEAG